MCAERIRDPDVVIVGSGIAGALIAKALATGGRKVLILEAGEALPPDINSYMNRFLMAKSKVPESPYLPELFNAKGDLTDPSTMNVGRPTVLSLGPKDSKFNDFQNPKMSYLVQHGPLAFGSTYERVNGGTSRHWLGTSLRFVPADFEMKSRYGRLSTGRSNTPIWRSGTARPRRRSAYPPMWRIRNISISDSAPIIPIRCRGLRCRRSTWRWKRRCPV